MKQLFIISFVLIIISMVSCKKEFVDDTIHNDSKTLSDYSKWRPSPDRVLPMINYFDKVVKEYRKSLENKTLYTVEDVSVGEGVWMVLSTLNYEYAEFNDSITIEKTETLVLKIANAGVDSAGNLLLDGVDLVAKYTIFEDSIWQALANGEIIQTICIDVSEVTTDSTEVTVVIATDGGYANLQILPLGSTPVPIPYACAAVPYQLPAGWHALSTEITKRINARKQYPPQNTYIYVGLSHLYVSKDSYWEGIVMGHNGWNAIWYNSSNEYLSVNQCNYYLGKAWWFANELQTTLIGTNQDLYKLVVKYLVYSQNGVPVLAEHGFAAYFVERVPITIP